MERRKFLSWVGVGLVASSLPVALAACSSEETVSTPDPVEPPPPPPEAFVREDGFVAIGPTLALQTDGFLAGKAGELAVIVTPSSDNETGYQAVDSTCTHQGCTVDWNVEKSQYECPCHSSRFNGDGSIVNGPAQKPLPSFDVKIEEDVVLVKPA